MAKLSLKQREAKREKLVAKYAKKYAELKAIADDAKRSDEERYGARLALQQLPAMPTPLGCATVAQSPAGRGARSACSASAET